MTEPVRGDDRTEIAVIAAQRERIAQLEAQVRALRAQQDLQADTLIGKSIDLIEREEEKARFFGHISHELRTPLTLILGPLKDALRDAYGPVEPPLRAQLTTMHRNALRLLRQINQLLDLSRLEAGRARLFVQHQDLIPLLRTVFSCFNTIAEQRSVRYTCKMPEGPLRVDFDADKLEKVVYNLLSNAFKYTPEGGAIRLSVQIDATDEGEVCRVGVKDTGMGIHPDHLAHIFTQYFRVDAGTTTAEGLGLGLALVHELVTLHRGTVRVESEVDFGSTFWVSWPVTIPDGPNMVRVDDAPPDATALSFDAALDAPSGLPMNDPDAPDDVPDDVPTIFVVDDHADIRTYIRSHLQSRYRVYEARHGAEALDLARQHPPDLIICDVQMPVMDGLELCRTLRADETLSYIPVVLLTIQSAAEKRLAGLAEGAVDFLSKPFNAEELVHKITNILRVQRIAFAANGAEEAGDAFEIAVTPVEVVSEDEAFLQHVQATIEHHMADEAFSVVALADHVGLSRVHLYRRLQQLTDLSPTHFIRRIRLERATQLLAAQVGSVSQVAYSVGFKSVAHFSSVFRAHTGETPSAYMARGNGG